MAPATVSALMLYAWPVASVPIVATTGIRSSFRSRCRMVGLTAWTWPTKPRSPSAGTARMRPASSPDTPTASAPCTLMAATSRGLTWPRSTIRAMSTVSASVTRRPLRNSGTLPSRLIRSLICGPPPWTTTGCRPTDRISTTSCAKRASASASLPPASALPPYLMTTTLPGEAPDVGQRLDQDGRLLVRAAGSHRRHRRGPDRAHGSSPTVLRPAVSGRPRATLADCSAPPDAPLARLSRAQRTIT